MLTAADKRIRHQPCCLSTHSLMERKIRKQAITMKYDKCRLEKNNKTSLLFWGVVVLPEAEEGIRKLETIKMKVELGI